MKARRICKNCGWFKPSEKELRYGECQHDDRQLTGLYSGDHCYRFQLGGDSPEVKIEAETEPEYKEPELYKRLADIKPAEHTPLGYA